MGWITGIPVSNLSTRLPQSYGMQQKVGEELGNEAGLNPEWPTNTIMGKLRLRVTVCYCACMVCTCGLQSTVECVHDFGNFFIAEATSNRIIRLDFNCMKNRAAR